MSECYVGEIRMIAGSFAPSGWMFCQGQIVSISDYETLYNLIGTTYGGDGQSTFGLPNLQSRLAMHVGSGYVLAQTGGAEQVTINTNQLPVHTHPFAANGNANSGTATTGTNAIFGSPSTGDTVYGSGSSTASLSPKAIGLSAGGSQPHSNIKPYLCVNFIIAMFGIYPSKS